MKIAVGSDHAGFRLKSEVLDLLNEMGLQVSDFGCLDTNAVDYPDVARAVAEAVAAGQFDRGILICGTGVGMSMAANKVQGVRAALCHDTFTARASREHNDANVLCMGERVIGVGPALDIVKTWLAAEFTGEERHARRVRKIEGASAEGMDIAPHQGGHSSPEGGVADWRSSTSATPVSRRR